MTDSSCEDVRRKLVDSPAGDSLGELLKHVESCERCRERLRGAMRDAGSAARDDAALAPELPKEDGDAKAPPRDWAPPDRGSRKGRAVPWVAALLSLALVGWMLAGTCGGMRSSSNELRSVNSWSGVVEAVSSTEDVGAAAEICRSGVCSAAAVGTRVEAGDTLRSGPAGRARLKLEDGTIVALERATTVVVDADEDAARLERGVLVVDSLVKLEAFTKRATSLRLDLPKGRASLASGKLAARVIGPTTTLEVLRGAAEVEGIAGAGRNVRVGQVVTWLGDGSPKVTHAGVAAPGLVMASIDEAAASGSRGLGELRAKKPGTDEERAGVVTLRRHAAKVRVVDGFARVEIDETFQNDGDEVLEGIYRFPLPPDAQIERLALEVDGKLEDGAFVDRDRAAAIWRGAIVNAGGRVKPREEIVWVPGPWKDPALLEWQRGGRFELRIFPIPRHGSRRVVLAYTLALPSVAGVRRVAVPLPHAARRDLRLDELSVDLEVRGHDPSLGLNVHGYDVVRASRGDVDALTFDRRGFVPSGDLTVEFASRARDHAVTAWAYALSSVNDVRSSGSAAGEATSATP
ncbi:MAG: FecR domain-containing protein, partial [Deltaproteobacteria bacterium]|nr:FecR domain-containing protein [Deltaproteobacteria bacterium]